MKCQDNGFLQAYIDGELEIDERKHLEEHLGKCEKCRDALNIIKSNDDFAYMKIKEYRDNIYDRVNDACEAVRPVDDSKKDKINNEKDKIKSNKSEKGVYRFMLKNRRIAAVACAAVMLTTCLAFQPVRAAISNTLLIFRANDLKGINFTVNDIVQIKDELSKSNAEIDLKDMGKIKTIGSYERKSMSIVEAKALTDFEVAFPSELSSANMHIDTISPFTMEFTLNVSSTNKILKSFGAKTLLPESIDGKTFTVDFPRVINMQYYDGEKDSFYMIQTKSPEIKAPEGVNPDDIYNSLVSMPILPDHIKQQLSDTKDWKNTLYIPVFDSESQEVSINGAKGYIMDPDSQYKNIVWYNKGVLYSISGPMSQDELIKIASSVR
ncbi:MAG TPA: DUF4367 domain-containing protein [Pseudobacteroides sp.]|nr:DUF4367 domain-containing protein [Pseudobacteroides sp.]